MVWGSGVEGMRRVTTSGYGVSFWDDKNVINLGGRDGFTALVKLHVKWVTYMSCEFCGTSKRCFKKQNICRDWACVFS